MSMQLAALINRFTFGEVSTLLGARNDLDKHGAACKTLLNFIPLLQGPVQRRGGTRFIAASGNGTNPVALINFAFSETTTYILEVGDRYLRFFYQGTPVMNGGTPYQITTPWRQADIFQPNGLCALKWVQSGDVMYIVCPGQPPQKLSRHGHTDWRIEKLPGWGGHSNARAIALFRERLCLAYDQTICMSQSGAFENFQVTTRSIPEVEIYNTTGITINDPDPGALTILYHGAVRAEVSFLPEEVRFERVGNTTVIGRPKEGKDGLTRFGVTVVANPGDIPITPNGTVGTITIGDRSASTSAVISFDPIKGEISRDGSADSSYIVRASSTAVAADDPLEINVYSEQMDRIEWLCPSSGLLVGTTGGEFLISETTTVDPLGPENVKVVPETAFGSSAIQAIRIGSVIIFVQRSGRKVREFAYDYAGDNYLAMDLTVAAEHITAGGLIALAWQSEPIETLWTVRPDGQLIGFTYCKDQDMTAWHRHQLGGGGRVSQLAVIPAAHGGRDELWLSVRREISGRPLHTIERMEAGHEYGGDQAEAFFVDAGLTVRGSGLTTVSGLAHLEGLEVDVLGDGAVQKRQMVSGGRINLEYPVAVAHVGLPYDSILTTVNMDAQLQDGSIQGRKKRIVKVLLRLVESGGGAAGPDPDHLEFLEYRRGQDRMDQAPDLLFSGDKLINWPHGWETDGSLTVVQAYPLPLTLTALVAWTSLDGLN